MRHNQAALLPNTIYDSRWFRASYLPDKAYCVLALPINLERVNARGVYLIGCNRGAGRSTNYDLSLLEAAVTQIGMAIENAILFKNQAERSIQLSLINEVSQAATSILNLDVMLRTVVKAIRRTFAFHNVAIHLYNPQTNWIELRAKATGSHYSHMAPPPPEEVITHRLRQGLIGWAVATNKTILANDVTKDPRYIFSPHDKEVRSELCIPIALSVKTIGVLDLQSTQLEAFDKYHVSALETLADQLAIAIENARLYEEINRRIEELKSLNEIGQAITSTLDLQKTLTLITAHTTRLMNTAAASVALLDEETCEVWFAAASGEGSQKVIGLRMPLGQGIAGWVAQQGEAVIIPDAYADPRFFAEVDQSSGFTTVSILCVPLQSRGRNIGAIEVMNKKGGEFDREDRSLLQALALSAATAIENAQLYEKQTRTINRLAETQNQLVQSAKLAAVGELAAGIAHEINNPLTTIIGLASLLLDTCDYETEDERLEDLQMVNEEARRARDIVRRLLNFARADTTLQRQPADLNQIIEEAIYLVYTKSVSQQIELEKSLAPLPKIPLDVNQVKQVIVNLLNNAVQAMLERPARRPAYLSVTTQLLPPSSPQATGEVVCQIKDTGPGIAPEYLHKIFDPFFTTKEVGQGTGLGLSISYSIVRNHGGQITVSSALGQETVFTVSLPLVIT
jgi:signal transduction histidine kinase